MILNCTHTSVAKTPLRERFTRIQYLLSCYFEEFKSHTSDATDSAECEPDCGIMICSPHQRQFPVQSTSVTGHISDTRVVYVREQRGSGLSVFLNHNLPPGYVKQSHKRCHAKSHQSRRSVSVPRRSQCAAGAKLTVVGAHCRNACFSRHL